MKPSRSPLLPLLFALGALALGPWLDAALADPGDVAVPNVVGQSKADATAALEQAGFQVSAVDIAAGTPGQVQSQVPAAGTNQAQGAQVEIRVGTDVRIQTQAPDVRGKTVAEVTDAYAGAYVIEIQEVPGNEADQGKVVAQDPQPGQPLLYRGILHVSVVPEPTPASVIVPSVLGKTETEARALIQDAGLQIAVTYVQDPIAGPGIVVSQDPPCCGEILAGGLVAIRVNGEPPEEPSAQVTMPSVTGLTMNEASHSLLMAGLVPEVQFQVVSSSSSAWTCLSQDPPAGQNVPSGATVHLVVGIPSQNPAQVRVPPLYGLTGNQAGAVLASLGLQAQVSEHYSLYTPGRVYTQAPPSGQYVPAGSVVEVHVAKAPPGGWQPPGVQVPALTGLTPAAAFVKLVASGLWGHQHHHVSPGAQLGVIDAQNPAAGSLVGPGTTVSFYLPRSTTVPALVGDTKAHALTLLLQAKLNGAAQGPPIGLGATKVTNQSVAAGTKLAEGTTIHFTYTYTGGIGPVQVSVPNLVGKTKPQAVALLQAKGLNGQFVGPLLGIGTTKVTSQNPAAGAHVPAGSTVTAHYTYTGGLPPLQVAVPNVVGMTKSHAVQTLQNANLGVHLTGPAFGLGVAKITTQNPAAGAHVPSGTVVNLHYAYGGGLQPIQVKVPLLIGMTKAQAAAALQAKGLQEQFIQPAFGIGFLKVVSQTPPSGTFVPSGSTVKATLQYSGGLVQKVAVPSVINMSKAAALAAIQSAGLKADLQGPQFGFGSTKVVSQSPAAGTLVLKNSTVTAHYVFGGVVVQFVKVPNVVGMGRLQAKAAVQAKGLQAHFTGPILGPVHVVSQNPAPGTLVAKGSTVNMVVHH